MRVIAIDARRKNKYFVIDIKLINSLTILKEIQESFNGVYDVCCSNTKVYEVEKITIIGVDNQNLSCNTQLCAPETFDYNITCNGKTILTTIYFSTQRIILVNGLNQNNKLL